MWIVLGASINLWREIVGAYTTYHNNHRREQQEHVCLVWTLPISSSTKYSPNYWTSLSIEHITFHHTRIYTYIHSYMYAHVQEHTDLESIRYLVTWTVAVEPNFRLDRADAWHIWISWLCVTITSVFTQNGVACQTDIHQMSWFQRPTSMKGGVELLKKLWIVFLSLTTPIHCCYN